MSDDRIEPASRLTAAELAALFTRGYQGYFTPVALAPAEFEQMALTSDFDLDASRVVLEDGLPVAFALLGVRDTRGWVGGMGVVAEARGSGHGRRVMAAVVESARQRKVRELDLEVLEQNVRAAAIYEELGFRDRRWLDVWVREPAGSEASHLASAVPDSTSVVAIPGAEEVPVAECLALHGAYHRERSPWQRDLESLRHWAPRLSALGIRDARGIRGWVLYRLSPGRLGLSDLAIAPGDSIVPIAQLLGALIAAHPGSTTLLVNLPSDDPFAAVLRELGAAVKFRQREMTLALTHPTAGAAAS